MNASQPSAPHRGPAAQQAPSNGLGVAALVLGILAIVLAFVPILGFASYPLALVGIVLGAVGLARVRARRATNRGVTVAGLVLSIVGLVCVIIATVLYVGAINAGVQGVDRALNAPHNVTYQVTATRGTVLVTYTTGQGGTAQASGVATPWSTDVTVTGSTAVLSASTSLDTRRPNQAVGLTCSIVDRDTGRTVVTNTVQPAPNASISCATSDLGEPGPR